MAIVSHQVFFLVKFVEVHLAIAALFIIVRVYLSPFFTIHLLLPVGTCTFEAANICGWINDKSDNFDWSRASGSTASVNTGPRNDHTYGTSFG